MRRARAFALLFLLCGGACKGQVDATPTKSGVLVTNASITSFVPKVPSAFPIALDTPPATGERFMVATDAALATKVGADLLQRGANVVDAAVGIAFALAVVYPQAGNLGGGGFLVYRTPEGQAIALDFRETAPRTAHRDMFVGPNMPKDASLVGHLAAGVPGTVAGLVEAHQRYGKLRWADICQPAIKLAEDGFVVDEEFAESVRDNAEDLGRFPASTALFLPGDNPIAQGSVFKNPDLAKTLRRIAEQGAAGFYQGETADLIVAEMKRGKGIISHEDLRSYKAVFRKPLDVEYRGHHVLTMPPPSSGGLVLSLMLDVLEGYDLRAMGWHSPEAIHIETETMRRVFALRNELLGDPDFVTIPFDKFLSDSAAASVRASISRERATPSKSLGSGIDSGEGQKHTTHFSVVDEQGGAVAMTTTINTSYGSGVTVTGAGFLLNNEMDDFATQPGHPNVFGLVQGESNAIAPGKRMLSSMTPTVVVGPDGKVRMVIGAAGGPTIITATFHVLSNVIDYGMNIRAAVGAPRFHHQHLPDKIFYEENGLSKEVLDVLRTLGHDVAPRRAIADSPAILRVGSRWTGSSEPRNTGGLALGK